MKKIQLAFLLLLFAGSAYAQFEDTKFVIGGAADYNSGLFPNASSIGISPTLAKTINSNALIGLSFNYYASVAKYDGSDAKQIQSGLGAGIFYQHYYKLSDKVFFNWQAMAGLNLIDYETEDSSAESKYYNIRWVPGFGWQVMEKLMLSASLGGISYYHRDGSSESPGFSDSSRENQLGIRFNNPQFGFTYLIN